jgi:hypothetical protein
MEVPLEKLETENPEKEKPEKQKSDKEKPDKVKEPKASRTIETMFRTTLQNHQQLTILADQKAALMVSINSIIISIMTSFLVTRFDSTPALLIPTALMVVVCLLTITFALLSTKPKINIRKFTPAEGTPGRFDLLFFGDYLSLSSENYKVKMKELITNDDKLYDSMIDNIYSQGQVLGRKFKLLQTAYTIFMYGFPLVVLCYLVTLYLTASL